MRLLGVCVVRKCCNYCLRSLLPWHPSATVSQLLSLPSRMLTLPVLLPYPAVSACCCSLKSVDWCFSHGRERSAFAAASSSFLTWLCSLP